jgi:hypothetical protein
VAIGGEEYIIEPIKGHPNASADDQREHPHLIYKRSAVSSADEKASQDDDDGHGTCGNDGLSLFFLLLASSSVASTKKNIAIEMDKDFGQQTRYDNQSRS